MYFVLCRVGCVKLFKKWVIENLITMLGVERENQGNSFQSCLYLIITWVAVKICTDCYSLQ